MNDKRSRKIIYLAHCLLNQNAKVEGLAAYPGTFRPLARLLLKSNAGLVQLPCPEMACLGPKRPLGPDTVEQYDTPKNRAACRKLARAAALEMKAYQRAGCKVLAALGVEGSPSCSAKRVPRLVAGQRRLTRGGGLFIEALKKELNKAGLRIPVIGIPESDAAGELRKALKRVSSLLSSQ